PRCRTPSCDGGSPMPDWINLPEWAGQVFSLSLSLTHWQELGLAFLLGSFAVATWSDIKHLAAQREFLEIWLGFLAVILLLDVYESGQAERVPWQVPAVKWGLIVLFSVLSFRQVGVLFRLAPGDVAALAAAACLLSPVLVVIFYLVARLL